MNSSVGIPLLLSEKEYFPCVCMHAWARVCLHVCAYIGPRYGACVVCVCVCVCVYVPVCTSLKYLWARRLQLGKASV